MGGKRRQGRRREVRGKRFTLRPRLRLRDEREKAQGRRNPSESRETAILMLLQSTVRYISI
jgi:hypothetical protein